MPIKTASKDANDKSGGFTIGVEYKDYNGDGVTPSSAAWSLFDDTGNVINSRSSVSISALSTSNDITMEPEDVDYADGDTRYLLVEYTYTVGANSHTSNDQLMFNVQDLRGVS